MRRSTFWSRPTIGSSTAAWLRRINRSEIRSRSRRRNFQLGPVLADLSGVPINETYRFCLSTRQRHRLGQCKRRFFIQRIELKTELTARRLP
jgi:hypothetical protein